MPGLVLCGRRWAIASDDVFIPAIILFLFHSIGATTLITIISIVDYDPRTNCSLSMYEFLIGYLIILLMMIVLEFTCIVVSCRGSVLDTKPRKFLQHIIYSRLVLLIVEIGFILWGIYYLAYLNPMCKKHWYNQVMKQSILTIIILASILIFILLLSITCVYDRAGKSFHRLKLFEFNYKHHPNKVSETARQLRHRETLYHYHENWKIRFKLLCCCIKQNKNEAAFANIAETLSCFFHKYDVVPSDILAGLLLIRERQRQSINHSLNKKNNGIYDYLSGVPVTQKTKFFNLNIKEEFDLYRDLIYFSDYAAASYGWPFYIYRSRCACLKLLPNIFNCLSSKKLFEKKDHSIIDDDHIENDNCCFCYYDAVLKQLPDPVSKQSMLNLHDEIKLNKKFKNHVKLIHANFSSDVGKPSYFVAVDFNKRKIVITIRGTESLTDSITDMQWKAIKMPNVDESFGWYGHEGIVKASIYIKEQLEAKKILESAFNYRKDLETDKFDLLVVGHSLGAGVAAVLSILMRDDYSNIKCFSYSPPGGLLSKPCVDATKEFITTVILGKDMVPRLGMVQMEKLRNEIMETLKNTTKPKVSCIK